jgi:hypothetical protein
MQTAHYRGVIRKKISLIAAHLLRENRSVFVPLSKITYASFRRQAGLAAWPAPIESSSRVERSVARSWRERTRTR